MSIKISSAKAKGRRLQQWVCEQISKLTGIVWGPDDECLIQSRPMGQHGNDVILRGKAKEKFPFSVECKSSQTFNLLKTIEQVKNNKKNGTDWIVFYKRREIKTPVVMLDGIIFFKLMKEIKNREEANGREK